MKVVDAAYLAGIIDGEGCFSISHSCMSGSYSVRLFVVQHKLERGFHHWMRQLGAGCTENKQSCIHYTWSGQKLKPLLTTVLPFLRIKHQHGRLAMQFIERMPGAGGCGRWDGPTQPKKWMKKAYVRMRKLNSR